MTRWLGTIVSRIFWLHLAALVATTVVMTFSIHLLLNNTLATFEHRTLGEHASAIAETLGAAKSGLSLDMSPQLKNSYLAGDGGYAFAVVDTAGRPLFSSLRDGRALFPADPKLGEPSYFQRTGGRHAFFGASYPERRGGQTVWVQVSQDLDHPDVFADDVVAQFLARVGWLIVPILLLLLISDVLIVRRVLAPVREASARAEAIDQHRIDLRLPTEALPTEIAPLVSAINRALDRLEAGFRTQRDFTADVAHELRTPLAVLRLRADALADHELSAQLRSEIDAMSRMVDQLLAIAELETFMLTSSDRADLREVGLEVSSVMAPLAIAQGKRIELAVGEAPVWVNGNTSALFRALRNLVENALTHSPPRGAVKIAVETDGAVSVSDSGPGVAESERELIFERFWRRDRDGARGSGLGLSIVAQIVRAHGGSVEVTTAPKSGARFVLRLRPT